MSFKELEQKHNLVNRVILACGKHPTDADINPLLEERLERFYEDAVIEGMAKQIDSVLAQPEQAVVPFPSFMRKRIEQALEDAIHPTGMSVHDGKVKVLVSDLHRMLLVVNSAPPKPEQNKPLRLSPMYEYGHIHDAPQPEQESISTNDHLCAMLRQVHDVLACTALPMKRKWVGLTDEEIKEVLDLNVAPWSLSGVALQHVIDDARALEAKLKEKNGG
jgi:hypothetical protein